MLIQALQNPSLYDHPVERFELIETHISWVLLTGPYAYKIKKPVNLGFLDFSTLEARKFYCEEEVRLNRQFSNLYLGAIAITGAEEAPILNGSGEAIEYAVKMVQFPQGARLDRLLEEGRLETPQIDDLASQLALLHGKAAIADPESSFGIPQKVRQPIEETLQHIEQASQDFPLLPLLRKWSLRETERLECAFLRRKEDGFVRECHGDLHLANIVLIEGRPVPFDCIEFNENLRWIDVMSEIAFLTMDLEDRKAPRFANRFLNSYLEATGDYEGLQVLRYYQVYRALVRAKVAAIRLLQGGLKSPEEEAIRRQYGDYLHLALRYTTVAPPTLMITHGPSGSGKSRWSGTIVESTGAIRLRTDSERKRMFGLKAEERSGPDLKKEMYGVDATRQVYQKLADLAQVGLEAGYSLIIDGTFLKRDQRRLFQNAAESIKASFVILDFQASEEALRRRVLKREEKGRDASEADLSVLELQRKTDEPFGKEELPFVVRVDTEK